jgi:hypothetical protein
VMRSSEMGALSLSRYIDRRALTASRKGVDPLAKAIVGVLLNVRWVLKRWRWVRADLPDSEIDSGAAIRAAAHATVRDNRGILGEIVVSKVSSPCVRLQVVKLMRRRGVPGEGWMTGTLMQAFMNL